MDVFYVLYIHFHSFSQLVIQMELLAEKMITSFGSKLSRHCYGWGKTVSQGENGEKYDDAYCSKLVQTLLWVGGKNVNHGAKTGKSMTMPTALN